MKKQYLNLLILVWGVHCASGIKEVLHMKKILCLGTISLVIMGMSISQAFSDVSDKHWAKSAIDKMVEQGIISGYTDGTYQPSRNLSKIESLILLSKVAGVNKYSDAAIKFEKEYEEILANYKTTYKKQVAYLLGVGVLKEDELANLISADKLNSPITREEMAVLVTKILGKEEEVKNKSFVVLPFDDTSSISATSKPYVEYVYNQSIMKGLTSNKFSPKEYVTRAQAAIILNSIVPKVDIVPEVKQEIVDNTQATVTLTSGIITGIDTILKTIEIDEDDIYEYDEKTKIYLGSTQASINSVKPDMKIANAKIIEGTIEELRLDVESSDNTSKEETDKKEKTEDYIIGEILEVTSKKVIIELESGEEITAYPEDEYQVIDAEDAATIKLKKVDEEDKVILVGEFDGDDYFFTVLVKY